MRLVASLSALFLLSCTTEASLTIEVAPLNNTTFNVASGATIFSVTLTEANLSLLGVEIVDSAGVPTQSFLGEREVDLLLPEATILGTSSLIPREITQLQITPGDASSGDLIGLSLRASYAVTLSDTTTSNVLVELSTDGAEEQLINTQIVLFEGDVLTAALAFDPSRLLSGVDYDALNQNGAITIRAETGDPNIDTALSTIQDNLLSAFSLSEVR